MRSSRGAVLTLKELDLSYNDLGDDGIFSLSKCISQGKLPKLESIILRQVGATKKSLLALIEGIGSGGMRKTLRRVDISGNQLHVYKTIKKGSSTYADKLGKKLGVDISKYTGKSASEVFSSTAAAATPLISDGLAKLSHGISGLSNMIENGADAGLKMLGGDDYSDAGIIDATDPRGYGYGVTYGKSRKSGIYNERRGKMSGSRRREKPGRVQGVLTDLGS